MTGSASNRLVRGVAVIGVVLALVLGLGTGQLLAWYLDRELALQAEAAVHQVERRVGEYQAVLLGLRGLFDTFGGLSSAKFNQYVDRIGLEGRYPGILHMEYVERVPEGGELRAKGIPVYRPDVAAMADDGGGGVQLATAQLALSEATAPEIAGFGRVGTVTDGMAGNLTGLAYRLPIFVPGAPMDTPDARRNAYLGAVGVWLDHARLFSDGISGGQGALAIRVTMPRGAFSGGAVTNSVVFESDGSIADGVSPLRQRHLEFADHGFDLAVFERRAQGWAQWAPVTGGAVVGGVVLVLALWATAVLRTREERRRHEHDRQLTALHHRLTLGVLAAGLEHELRQPLQVIGSSVSLLRDATQDELTPQLVGGVLQHMTPAVERANGRLRHIQQLIQNAPAVGDEQVGVHELLVKFRSYFSGEARRYGCRLVVSPPDRGWLVHGELLPLEGVLANLARNGFQAMKEAGVAGGVVLITADARDGSDMLRIVVADAGPGLPPARLAVLFDSFNTTKREGMGVGLSICRQTVERFGGSITARNRSEGGAEFSISLKVTGRPAPVPASAAD